MTGLFEGVGIALTSLRAHKMRAALTILGVAIGVTVVMVIGALISGFNKGITDMLASLGPKTFWVGRYWGGQGDADPEDPNPWRRRPPITVEEANRLAQLPTIAFVVVDEGTSADVEFEGRRVAAVRIRGRNADWPKIEGGHINVGRSFTHLEDAANSHVVVVNTKLAENLFGQRDPMNRRVKMRGLRPGQKNNFDAITQQVYVQAINSFTLVARVLMIALSMVGLMVGGIGVVAIMMISVTERTREIGVRKALGATKREVMWQFLVEGSTLTLVGGIVGMIIGWGIAIMLHSFTPVPAYVPLGSIILALTAAAVTGLLFGIYPASKAARLDPVEALRYE